MKFIIFAILLFATNPSFAGSLKGQACKRSDKDPVKCMVCMVYVEGRTKSAQFKEGVQALAYTVLNRVKSSRWPSHKGTPDNACGIIHEPSQTKAAGAVLREEYKGQIDEIAAIVKEVLHRFDKRLKEAGGDKSKMEWNWDFLSWNGCSRPKAGQERINGNCFRADALPFLVENPAYQESTVQTAELPEVSEGLSERAL